MITIFDSHIVIVKYKLNFEKRYAPSNFPSTALSQPRGQCVPVFGTRDKMLSLHNTLMQWDEQHLIQAKPNYDTGSLLRIM